MVYKVLADLVMFAHFLWILFLILGGIWGVKIRVVKVVHIGALAFAFVINVFGLTCPLTDLEVWLAGKGARRRPMPAPSLRTTWRSSYTWTCRRTRLLL